MADIFEPLFSITHNSVLMNKFRLLEIKHDGFPTSIEAVNDKFCEGRLGIVVKSISLVDPT